ncbi:conserved hypothetical protein [Ixodes scapularis]|uniref:Protein LTV1 homolog n=1 Tax=Ixodes scapularis TaxID=6945 RepID=B7PGV4_IXOSC|nr:conserved hypothetical protein [Ixodes scapularis]|eukprot:XP_002401463.1 conserved hypothetical protein [Ixodes scapularis]
MPGGKRKKFIDKKNAVTFQLVHRSQKDPLQADETAPKHVLLEKRTGRPLQTDDLSSHGKAPLEKRKEEQRKYGIYFDDDYNYLQHLKDVNRVADWEPVIQRVRVTDDASGSVPTDKKNIRLPSSVFQSNVEEKEGLLNKVAPQVGPRPDWDPDVVAALDDDFDFEDEDNELEDDFVKLADGPAQEGIEGIDEGAMEDDNSDDYVTDDEEEVGSDDGSEGGFSFAEEEVRSRFTNYSMSSSVIRRTEGLKTLDERFEQLFEQYDDLELGALDGEEIEGCLQPDSEIMKQIVEEYQRKTRLPTLKEVMMQERANMAPLAMESIAEEDELVDVRLECDPGKERWDCESIISAIMQFLRRPWADSVPFLIPGSRVVQLSSRTGLPVKDKGGLSRQGLKRLEQELGGDDDDRDETRSRTSVASSIRPKNETPEERRLRKAQVRALRKERRQEKKANSLAFKAEELRQEKAMANVRKSLTSMRLM